MYNQVKNLISGVMIILLISHGIIQFGMFEILQSANRSDVAEMIDQGVPSSGQIILGFEKKEMLNSISGLEWIDENEFRYNGRMFDIINKVEKGDSVYLNCIDDSMESGLYSILNKFIENDTETQGKQHSLNNFFSQYYSLSEINIPLSDHQPDSYYHGDCINHLLEGEQLLNTPPPRA